jgi:hypothetical protein
MSMNCQRAKVSRLLICRHRNFGCTLVLQIGHNVCVCDVAGFRSRALSHETKRCNLKLLKFNQSSGHSANILLCTVPQSTVTEQHGCQSFGCGLMTSGLALVLRFEARIYVEVAVG